MSGRLSATNLKDRTREYWEKSPGYDCYIEELLGMELREAGKDSARLRGVGKPVHTLAITVGESFEPLLQLVCVLRPQRVVLILNAFYGNTPGEDKGRQLKRLMVKLAKASNVPERFRPALEDASFELRELQRDTPTQVFRALREAMQDPRALPPDGHTNVIDITGAKKSMVVGAFLFAAHSGIPITYVDFDEYNAQRGKPYGYTCRIGEIANPYEAFRLRDWEQVRRLYESYNFRTARALLSDVINAMAQPLGEEPLFAQTDVEKVGRLSALLEMYEAWENGDYATAKALRDRFSLSPDLVPSSIDELGDIWPNVSAISDAQRAAEALLNQHLALKQGAGMPSLFAQPMPLLAYVRDELAKIERLIDKNEDYRSAYLRAAGLDEFLLKARLVMCWFAGKLTVQIGNNSPLASNALNEPERSEAFKALVNHSGADVMRQALCLPNSLEIRKKRGKEERIAVCTTDSPSLSAYWQGTPLDFDAFTFENRSGFARLRGEAIHTHLYIPRPIAEAALELVTNAVAEFERNWLEHFYPGTLAQADGKSIAAPSWTFLCEKLELDFLPPRLRR